MKDTSKYVEELLYRHQCVIIPNFGAFISNRKSATISQDKTFSPPSKTLTFNSRLISNDGLLIKHISEAEKINYDLAQSKVQQSVATWKKELESGETIKFANIGYLTHEGEGRITFSPSESINLLTDSFGMSSFVPQEAKKIEEEKQEPQVSVEKVVPPIVETSKQEAMNSNADEALKSEPKKKSGYLKYAAIIVLGFIAITYGVFSYLNQNEVHQNNDIADKEALQKEVNSQISEATFLSGSPLELPSISLNVIKGDKKEVINESSKENIKNDSNVEKTSKDKKDKKEISKEKKSNTEAVSKKYKYHVIAGAFSSQANAENRVKQLKKKGYKANVVGKSSKGLYLVSYQSFEKRSDANIYSKRLKSKKKLDSWVLSK